MVFDEDEYLLISGIQHFRFCRRQWALIHIENQWAENLRTVNGDILHRNAHSAEFRETRKNCVITREMRVFSPTLGITGACDVVELQRSADGISFPGMEGLYSVLPIEYKAGSPKEDTCDELQLCAQAMCLEEMLCCRIPFGAVYYGQTHHRMPVEFTESLRQEVIDLTEQMHDLMKRGHTPKVKPSRSCNACSLKDICLPKMMTRKPVGQYILTRLEEKA